MAVYEAFAARVEAVRDEFLAYLREAKAAGRKVAAYGAAAKGNTFLNYAGVTPADIVAVFDRNPAKQNKRLPGSHIPILSAEAVAQVRPDDVLILPWNFKDEIMVQLAYIRDWGGRFVTAAPHIEIVE
jgi:ABC-type Fe3+-hydroxamate transport system substrate-binding protein